MTVAEVEKKVNAKARHGEAILEFQAWLMENPNATLKRRVKHFDLVVDAAYYRSRLQ